LYVDLLVVSGSSSKNRDRWSTWRLTRGLNVHGHVNLDDGRPRQIQVDVQRTLAHLR
jgi:hypothetical protein